MNDYTLIVLILLVFLTDSFPILSYLERLQCRPELVIPLDPQSFRAMLDFGWRDAVSRCER
jgi:glutathione S-transferase